MIHIFLLLPIICMNRYFMNQTISQYYNYSNCTVFLHVLNAGLQYGAWVCINLSTVTGHVLLVKMKSIYYNYITT